MDSNDTGILALLAKGLRDLRREFQTLARQPGPSGADGREGPQGSAGDTGPRGPVGLDGADGKDGRDGKDGPQGKDGRDGADGKDGRDGKDGDTGPMPRHEWRGSELRFQLSPKRWGKWVDLRGPAGAGRTFVGAAGSDWSPDLLPAADDLIPSSFVVKQADEWRIASYEQVAAWLGGSALLTEAGDHLVTESGKDILQG